MLKLILVFIVFSTGLSGSGSILAEGSVSAEDSFVAKGSVPAESSVLAADRLVTLKKPPASIENWYKPANKRQVWLHTMFRLRRELLAMNDYSQSQQAELLQKWFKSFKKDYLEIGKMVPEWQGSEFINASRLASLQTAVENNKFSAIPKHLDELQKSCDSCHTDYQAISRLMYRTADFAKIRVVATDDSSTGTHKITYDKAMGELSDTLNRIKIAMHDDFYSRAIEHIDPLQSQLKNLGEGCSDCHKQATEQIDYILTSSQPILTELKQALEQKDNKKARISLGTFAVKTCARCHSVHRTSAEIKELLE